MAHEDNQEAQGDDGSDAERWPLLDWRDFSFGCGCIALPFVWLWAAAHVLADAQARRWTVEAIAAAGWAVVVTVAAVQVLSAAWRVIEVDDSGLAMRYRGHLKWQVGWAEVTAWRPEMRGLSLVALLVRDREGKERRLAMGPYRPWGGYAQRLLQSVQQHAGGVQMLPPLVQRDQRWQVCALVGVALLATVWAGWQVWQAYVRYW